MKITDPLPQSLLLKAAPYVLAIGLAGGWYIANNHHQQQVGAMRERAKTLVAKADSLNARIADVARHVSKDTVVVVRVATEYDTLYQDREHRITDTIFVKEILAKGDTLVRACRMLVADCALANARKDTMIANLHDQLRLETRLRPSRSRRRQAVRR